MMLQISRNGATTKVKCTEHMNNEEVHGLRTSAAEAFAGASVMFGDIRPYWNKLHFKLHSKEVCSRSISLLYISYIF